MKEERKPEYPEKTPGNELQKMPHTKAQRFKPQARLEPSTTALVAGEKSRRANRYTTRRPKYHQYHFLRPWCDSTWTKAHGESGV